MEAIYELYVEGGVTAIMIFCFVGQMVWMQKTLVQKIDEIHQEDIEDSKSLTSYLFGVRILIIILALVGLILWFFL